MTDVCSAQPWNLGAERASAGASENVFQGQADVLLRRANEAYRLGEFKLALSLCDLVHKSFPTRTDVLLLLGAIHYQLHNYAESAAVNALAIRLEPQLAEAHANLANALQRMGNIDLAIVYYRAALMLKPTFTDALNNLAGALVQKGSVPMAMEAYVSALSINPGLVDVRNNLGDLWRAQGFAGQMMAQQCYLSALQINGSYAPAWRGLGELMRETQDNKQALICFKEALRHRPNYAEAYTGLGVALKELKFVSEAEACFEAAVALKPRCALSLGNLAGVCYEQGKLDRAIAGYQQAIIIEPNFPEAYNNLGNALREAGRASEAIACYAACIQLQYKQIIGDSVAVSGATYGLPCMASMGLMSTIGVMSQQMGGVSTMLSASPFTSGATPSHIAAAQACGQAQRLSVACNNLGGILKMQGMVAAAIACYKQVVMLQPESPEAHSSLGSVYKESARHDMAVSCYRQALALRNDYPDAFANLIHSLQCICDWSEHSSMFKRLEREVRRDLKAGKVPPVQPFHAMAYPFPASLALEISKVYAGQCVEAAAKFRAPNYVHPPAVRLAPGQRFRVGYVSSDFGNHPLSHLMRSVFGMHDRSRIEVFCYCLSANDNSEWRNHIEAEAEHVIDVSSWGVVDIANRIKADGIHVALNLNGYTKGARNEIFALQPAPVQASYMGFPATMGATFIQYLITDKVVAPPHLHHLYSESLAVMPNCYFVNDYKQSHLDALIKEQLPKRADFGLPEDKIIFSCSNQLYKYDPKTFQVWCNILHRVPNSVLWLLRFPPQGEDNIRLEASKRGISQDRIIFTDVAAKEVHIKRSGLADVFLDTPLCNAHTTGCDVLWGGCPIVTLPLEHMASRVAASLAYASGLGAEMVVSSHEEYEERAVELGNNHSKRLSLRHRLEEARLSSPLFDTRRWVRDFENVLFQMWDIHASGQKPHSFEV